MSCHVQLYEYMHMHMHIFYAMHTCTRALHVHVVRRAQVYRRLGACVGQPSKAPTQFWRVA